MLASVREGQYCYAVVEEQGMNGGLPRFRKSNSRSRADPWEPREQISGLLCTDTATGMKLPASTIVRWPCLRLQSGRLSLPRLDVSCRPRPVVSFPKMFLGSSPASAASSGKEHNVDSDTANGVHHLPALEDCPDRLKDLGRYSWDSWTQDLLQDFRCARLKS